jgi:hypothetical protein
LAGAESPQPSVWNQASRTQGGEEDHFIDARHAGEEHRDTIHSDAETARRRQTEFERAQIVLVDRAAFGVAGFLGGLLLFEACSLFDRVVQFGVPVGEFARTDEQLEALGEERIVAIGACQR